MLGERARARARLGPGPGAAVRCGSKGKLNVQRAHHVFVYLKAEKIKTFEVIMIRSFFLVRMPRRGLRDV